MSGKIVACLDGSKFSEKAVRYALNEASKTNSKIILFNVLVKNIDYLQVPPSGPIVNIPAPLILKEFTERRNNISLYLQQAAENLTNYGFEVETEIREGIRADIPDIIVSYAEENQVDLIVMATHNRRGIKKLFWGSITDSVARKSSIPILPVKPGRNMLPNKTIQIANPDNSETTMELEFSSD